MTIIVTIIVLTIVLIIVLIIAIITAIIVIIIITIVLIICGVLGLGFGCLAFWGLGLEFMPRTPRTPEPWSCREPGIPEFWSLQGGLGPLQGTSDLRCRFLGLGFRAQGLRFGNQHS